MKKILYVLFYCCVSLGANAAEIEYQFSGDLSGFASSPVISSPLISIASSTAAINLSNAPFQVTIFGDTKNINGLINNGLSATWNITGLDTASTSISQVNSLINVIGFSWGGHTFDPNYLTVPQGQYFGFSGTFPTVVPSFSSPVPQTPISLVTSLIDTSRLPNYTANILFPNIGYFTVTGMTNMTYSVTTVPEPSMHLLFISGLLIFVGIARKRKHTLV